MTSFADIHLDRFEIFEGSAGAVGRLVGTLTARSSGQSFDLTMIEVHDIADDTTRKMDIYVKDPAELAAFFTRSAAEPQP